MRPKCVERLSGTTKIVVEDSRVDLRDYSRQRISVPETSKGCAIRHANGDYVAWLTWQVDVAMWIKEPTPKSFK